MIVQDFATDSEWVNEPPFPSGAGGLRSTLDDWWRFGRMLLGAGTLEDIEVLRPESVRAILSDHLDDSQKQSADLFLEGQGWGYGGSVDGAGPNPWNVPGRYGWIGGTGTAAHVIPTTDTVSILLTQVERGGPASTPLLHDFFSCVGAR